MGSGVGNSISGDYSSTETTTYTDSGGETRIETVTATTTPTAGGDSTAQETSLDTTVSTSTGGGQETDGEAGNSIDGGYTSTVSASDSTTTASRETIGPGGFRARPKN